MHPHLFRTLGVGIAADFFTRRVPLHGHKKQHKQRFIIPNFQMRKGALRSQTTCLRSKGFGSPVITWPTLWSAKEQLEGQGTASKDVAPLSERGQIPLKSSPLQTCLCFPGHLILLILVWANGGIWSQEITTETIQSSLPPGLLGAKETRTEGPFEKEGLRPGGLEQGFLSVTREVILGRHRHIMKLHGITQERRHLLF